ncbi:MAG TPA: DNA repair protein RecO [Polyangia bacterium]|nr:DNA repair protein RecO [Polyangia bacterium]
MTGVHCTARAFLLRAVDYGESDRVLTLLTETGGKVTVMARGARRSARRFAGALEPLALIEVTLSPGRGALPLLSEAVLLEPHAGLSRGLERFGAASLVIELARECVAESEPEPLVFDLLLRLFHALDDADVERCRRLALAGALGLLTLAGTGVGADRCNACGKAVPPGRKVLFDPGRGGVICTSCGGGPIVLSAKAAALLRELSATPADALPLADAPAPSAIAELERAVQAFIDCHVPRPPRTRLGGARSRDGIVDVPGGS